MRRKLGRKRVENKIKIEIVQRIRGLLCNVLRFKFLKFGREL
jgi:hypothetical protein